MGTNETAAPPPALAPHRLTPPHPFFVLLLSLHRSRVLFDRTGLSSYGIVALSALVTLLLGLAAGCFLYLWWPSVLMSEVMPRQPKRQADNLPSSVPLGGALDDYAFEIGQPSYVPSYSRALELGRFGPKTHLMADWDPYLEDTNT